jgi:hypothetical protein
MILASQAHMGDAFSFSLMFSSGVGPPVFFGALVNFMEPRYFPETKRPLEKSDYLCRETCQCRGEENTGSAEFYDL